MKNENKSFHFPEKFILAMAFPVALSLLGASNLAMAADEDGCYNPPNRCLSVSSEWTSSGNLKLNLANNCRAGVYAKWCVLKAGGGDSCGASHISKGRTYSTTMYNAHESGRHAWRFVGSERSSKDWVCAHKRSGWDDDFSYH